ncbi:MAG TPA: hypothetical protein VEM95_05410 [Thermoplasmata archaeon]|nr:hypothetical protein [Thermoplasmata archaeon]
MKVTVTRMTTRPKNGTSAVTFHVPLTRARSEVRYQTSPALKVTVEEFEFGVTLSRYEA